MHFSYPDGWRHIFHRVVIWWCGFGRKKNPATTSHYLLSDLVHTLKPVPFLTCVIAFFATKMRRLQTYARLEYHGPTVAVKHTYWVFCLIVPSRQSLIPCFPAAKMSFGAVRVHNWGFELLLPIVSSFFSAEDRHSSWRKDFSLSLSLSLTVFLFFLQDCFYICMWLVLLSTVVYVE